MEQVNWVQLMFEALLLFGGFVVMYWKQRVMSEHRFTKLEVMVASMQRDSAKLDAHIASVQTSIQQLHGRVSKVKEQLSA